MGNNGASDNKPNTIEVGGREFRRVGNGLDEAQVTSFINELISQRDTLVQREGHLSSLAKLTEKMVIEADNLAEEIKTKAIDQGKAEAVAIIAQAEEQAQQMIEEKRAEIITIANEQAAAIKAEAERKAELLLGKQTKIIQDELRNSVHQLCSQLVSELDSLKQQAVALGAAVEEKLSQVIEETSAVTTDEDEIRAGSRELIPTIDQTITSKSEGKALVSAGDKGIAPYEQKPEFEVEIMPPIDIIKMMGIVNYIDSLPEVKNTELIPLTDNPSILVFLHEPIHLIDTLKTLPEVAQVKEDLTNTAGAEGGQRKVQIVLSENGAKECPGKSK